MTCTDIAIAAGVKLEGADPKLVESISQEQIKQAQLQMTKMISEAIDYIKTDPISEPLIIVGGGSILLTQKSEELKFFGISQILKPAYFGYPNAIGAALAQISCELEQTVNL